VTRRSAAQPTLRTPRLVLRPFRLEDAADVQRLCSSREIAATTLAIPHPYPEGAAEAWIAGHAEAFARRELAHFAITRPEDEALLGAISLTFECEHNRAELGFWVGVPFWGCGYATEAAAAVLRYAFEVEGLQRVYAFHFTNNPASGRVLQKIGMTHEGTRRRHTLKWDRYLDSEAYAILRDDWEHASPL
jgi:RimJ/RimL family protein N-acetyltransferase